jgi:hypothetical protein
MFKEGWDDDDGAGRTVAGEMRPREGGRGVSVSSLLLLIDGFILRSAIRPQCQFPCPFFG